MVQHFKLNDIEKILDDLTSQLEKTKETLKNLHINYLELGFVVCSALSDRLDATQIANVFELLFEHTKDSLSHSNKLQLNGWEGFLSRLTHDKVQKLIDFAFSTEDISISIKILTLLSLATQHNGNLLDEKQIISIINYLENLSHQRWFESIKLFVAFNAAIPDSLPGNERATVFNESNANYLNFIDVLLQYNNGAHHFDQFNNFAHHFTEKQTTTIYDFLLKGLQSSDALHRSNAVIFLGKIKLSFSVNQITLLRETIISLFLNLNINRQPGLNALFNLIDHIEPDALNLLKANVNETERSELLVVAIPYLISPQDIALAFTACIEKIDAASRDTHIHLNQLLKLIPKLNSNQAKTATETILLNGFKISPILEGDHGVTFNQLLPFETLDHMKRYGADTAGLSQQALIQLLPKIEDSAYVLSMLKEMVKSPYLTKQTFAVNQLCQSLLKGQISTIELINDELYNDRSKWVMLLRVIADIWDKLPKADAELGNTYHAGEKRTRSDDSECDKCMKY